MDYIIDNVKWIVDASLSVEWDFKSSAYNSLLSKINTNNIILSTDSEILIQALEDIAKRTQDPSKIVRDRKSISVEKYKWYWTREYVKSQSDKVFLFGDNTDDRLYTWYVPRSTQAVIRLLPNAIGIDTKKDRGTNPNSYFSDDDFIPFKRQVDEAIQQAKDSGKTIVIPSDGIGTGKAMLESKAPKLFNYLQESLNKLLLNSDKNLNNKWWWIEKSKTEYYSSDRISASREIRDFRRIQDALLSIVWKTENSQYDPNDLPALYESATNTALDRLEKLVSKTTKPSKYEKPSKKVVQSGILTETEVLDWLRYKPNNDIFTKVKPCNV